MSRLTAARLRTLIHYDWTSGSFTWLVGPGFRRDLDGAPAGSIKDRHEIMIDGANHKAHRLAWLYMTGEWPEDEIDHRDGDALNNRWSNLRAASRTFNQQNLRRAHRDSTSGFLGVTPKRNRFAASICVNRKKYRLGTFATAEEAHAAYLVAKRRLHDGCTI